MNGSVIIPMYNAGETIRDCLNALENQTHRDFEVVVVDDGSKDDSKRIVEEFAKATNLRFMILSQENRGPAAARNLGVSKVSGDVVIFLDSDCISSKNWLAEMIKPFERGDVVGVQGAYETLNSESLVARYVGYEIAHRHGSMVSQEFVDWVASFSAAYNRKVFLDEGGFDVSFREANAEDAEFSFRLRKKNYKLVFNPKAVVAHFHPSTLYSYLRQQFFRGFWRIPMYLKHKTKLVKDSYTGSGIFIQALLSSLLFLSLLLLSIPWILVFFMLILLSNLPLGLFCFKQEKKFLLIAPVLASLRSLVGLLVALYGVLFFFFLKPFQRCVS